MVYYNDDIIQIRDLEEADVVSLFSWWIDKEINKHDPRPIPRDSKQLIDECIRYCNSFKQDILISEVADRRYMYFIITDVDNNPIGFINFFGVDKVSKQGELGVLIGDKRYWKKGIATKAVKSVVDHIFTTLDIDRVYIETGESNIPALKLFKNLGFEPCGEYFEDDGFKFIVMEIKR